MVPPSSDQVSRVWPYSGNRSALVVFTYVVLTLSDRPSHAVRLTTWVLNALRTPKVFLPSVCPLPRSLATTYGISFDVSSSPYLDVSVQAVPPMYLFWISVQRTWVWTQVSFLIQKSPDQCLFAAPRSLSQLITSFIGSQCQGIRPAPLFAWPFKLFSFENGLFPLDSFLPTKIIVTLPFEIVIFLKKELTIIFVSQLLFSFQGTSLSVLFRTLKIEQYLLNLYLSPVPDDRPS